MHPHSVSFPVRKAAIIGAGIGGIASAIRLAVKGYHVDVFERAGNPGGKLSEFEIGGYRFDFGPSLFTMPELVDDLFRLAGRNPQDHFRYSKLDIACRYFYPDDTIVNGYTDAPRFIGEISDKLGVKGDTVLNYLRYSRQINELTTPIFLEKSLHKLSTYLSKDTLRAITRIPSFDLHSTMHTANSRRLGDPRLVQLFDRFATYNGSSPYKAPGILNVIPSLEHLGGVYLPEGGMYDITDKLYTLASDLGVSFHFNSLVSEIRTDGKRASGIVEGGSFHSADIVVSNMDATLTYERLLSNDRKARSMARQERSSSAVVFYWGIDRAFDQLDVHNIFFSQDYAKEFRSIFEKGTITDDPTVYVNVTSRKVPGDAPAGCENWFVMINAPHDEGQNWDEVVRKLRQVVIDKLSHRLGSDISGHIAVERITDPVGIANETLSYKGALYGTSSNSRMAAFLRHPNFSRKIKNLYFSGGSVHPGGGIPLCLLSAKIIDEIIA